jgi:endonuclease/exonuclease/phosphatase family metal-dependent hydrolase
MHKLLAALAATLTLAACATTAPVSSTKPLKIASWNLEHLAEDGSTGCRPRNDADYAVLKAYADRLDADVVAFEEVQSVEAAARVFDPAQYDIVIESRSGGATPSPCRGLPGRFLNRQAVGFAIRKSVSYQRLADVTALQLGDPNLRSGVDIVVRRQGAAPLRLLAVHLKSGCASGTSGEACTTLQRQVPLVEAWIDARAAEGLRFAVLGDFNRRLAKAGDPIWADWDDGAPANADLALAEGDQAPRCDPRFKDFIDHVVLDRRAAADLVGFEELTYDGGGERPSDHCPSAVRLRSAPIRR